MKKGTHCPVVRDWIEAGTAIDKFGCFKVKKSGKIHKKIDWRLFPRKRKSKEVLSYMKGSLKKGDVVIHKGKDIEGKTKKFFEAVIE